MNRRIKKKKHLYPYTEYGIDLYAEPVESISLEDITALIGKIEEMGLVCGGSSTCVYVNMYICSSHTNYPKASQLLELRQWMLDSSLYKSVLLSGYTDAWYPDRKLLPIETKILFDDMTILCKILHTGVSE